MRKLCKPKKNNVIKLFACSEGVAGVIVCC